MKINSFGYGGSNAHIILEALPRHAGAQVNGNHTKSENRHVLLPLSASSEDSLEARFSDIAGYATQVQPLDDLAFTLSCRRSHLSHRSFSILASNSPLSDILEGRLQTRRRVEGNRRPKFLFMFTGQGSQWAGMGAGLAREFPLFSEVIDELSQYLSDDPHSPDWNLRGTVASRL